MLKQCSLMLIACSIAVGCSGDDAATPDARVSSDSAAQSDTSTTGVIPANTTDCELNAAGCLQPVATKSNPCSIEFTAPIPSRAVDVRVDGSLPPGSRGLIAVSAFAKKTFGMDGSFFWTGYSAQISRPGFVPNSEEKATGRLLSTQDGPSESAAWPMPSGAYSVSILASFNSATTTGSVRFKGTGAPSTALSSTAMLAPPQSDKLVIFLRRGQVCNVVITTP